jgi:hypothetical protein
MDRVHGVRVHDGACVGLLVDASVHDELAATRLVEFAGLHARPHDIIIAQPTEHSATPGDEDAVTGALREVAPMTGKGSRHEKIPPDVAKSFDALVSDDGVEFLHACS